MYGYDDHHEEGQHTVVTESRGLLAGRRVVRGRELECRARYAGGREAGGEDRRNHRAEPPEGAEG